MKRNDDLEFRFLCLDQFEELPRRLLVSANDNAIVSGKPIDRQADGSLGHTASPQRLLQADRANINDDARGFPIVGGIVLIVLASALALGVFAEATAVDSAMSDAFANAFSTSARALVPSGGWRLDSGW